MFCFLDIEHYYNLTNIQATWGATGVTYLNASTSGFRSADTVKYPFVDWTHQFTADVSSGFPVLPTLESAFRPFLHIKYLLDMIFAPTDFTYKIPVRIENTDGNVETYYLLLARNTENTSTLP